MLDVPFYLNRSHRCAQAAMKSVLKGIMPDRDFPYNELDKLTLHSKDKITFPCQIAYALSMMDFDFRYYIKPGGLNIVLSQDAENFARKYYGKYLNFILSKTDIDSLRKSAKELIGNPKVVETFDKPTIENLENMIKNKKIPICLVNYDIFVGRINRFNGHYFIITGFEDKEIIYHDNGPKGAGANKRAPIEGFNEAWGLCFFDHDLIVINS